MEHCICEYIDWSIIKTDQGLAVKTEDGRKKVIEVFRVEARNCPNYENLSFEEFCDMAIKAGIEFDYSGELDDCSAYVFWKVEED